MDQNSVLVENVESKPVDGNPPDGKPVGLSGRAEIDERGILTPEVSNLITSVNELAMNMAMKNFEMLKMATGNNLGLYQMRSR